MAGILLVLNGIPGKGHAKVLTAGIGWAGAEVLLTRFLLLWVGARGAEFDWKYIQKSLESNINLVKIYCLFNEKLKYLFNIKHAFSTFFNRKII